MFTGIPYDGQVSEVFLFKYTIVSVNIILYKLKLANSIPNLNVLILIKILSVRVTCEISQLTFNLAKSN